MKNENSTLRVTKETAKEIQKVKRKFEYQNGELLITDMLRFFEFFNTSPRELKFPISMQLQCFEEKILTLLKDMSLSKSDEEALAVPSEDKEKSVFFQEKAIVDHKKMDEFSGKENIIKILNELYQAKQRREKTYEIDVQLFDSLYTKLVKEIGFM